MIGLVDYGLGNLEAFASIYRRLGVEARRLADPGDLAAADRLILPGVGAFDWAMARLGESGLREALDEAVLGRSVPVLGVCVGMQMMLDRSEEGSLPGLGWIAGHVARLDAGQGLPLPHMGWNDLRLDDDPLFAGLAAPRFYFLHSFAAVPEAAHSSIAEADYGGRFCCAVRRDHIAGVQFHPEKSHHWGVRLLANFAGIDLG
ncbi:imidazole glycerol phosphate synthase subunit HisH [Rhizorhabdus sp. FW153]|uniref:imidazole glycerol phosphate synthase subunit HisH n=1 Tax=Rhizorhabdus sp. FW153 TaxID=3400216 RepID=UPI003CF1D33B